MYQNDNDPNKRITELEERLYAFSSDIEDRINNIDSGMLDEYLSKRLTNLEQNGAAASGKLSEADTRFSNIEQRLTELERRL